ncbi:hypothetical protein N9L06_02345 [Mariniblastus sp.]|nr:hypothetical protein [Mariniblastus sp.]
MKFTKIYTGMLVAAAFSTCGNVGAQTTTVTLADAAADYVDSLSAIDAEPTAFPSGWTYLVSDTASEGDERELTVLAGVGNGGNTGFGTAEAGFQVPAVVGNQNLGDQFEIFSDGFDGNDGRVPTGNGGVVGTDLLMVPGFVNENAEPVEPEPGEEPVEPVLGDSYVIARYTISAADAAGAVAETGSIAGNFRNLVARDPINANQGGSIDVFVFQNDTPLFSVDRENTLDDPAGNNGVLTQADGTFNVTGLTFEAGDTISFVIGNNENIGGDESALQAAISVDSSGAVAPTGDFTGDGIVDCADLDGYINNIDQPASGALAVLDIDGDGTLTADDADTTIRTLVQTSNGQVGTFPGDFNCDGSVSVLGDAFILVGNLNTSVTSYSLGDVDFDGNVSVLGDAFVLVANLNNTNEPQ